ncbi:MAG: hypothetical protein CMF55_06130 [Legionellales bacterium]|nr:hypothetical protein [Legionellales bacterium]
MFCSKPPSYDLLLLVDHDGSLGDQFANPNATSNATLEQIIRLLPFDLENLKQIMLACASLRQSFSQDILGMLMNAWQTTSGGKVITHFNGSIKFSLQAIEQALPELFPSLSIIAETFLLPDLDTLTSESPLPHVLQTPSPWKESLHALEQWLKQQISRGGLSFTEWLYQQPPNQDYRTRQQNIEMNWNHLFNHLTNHIDNSKFITLISLMHFSAINSTATKIYGLFIDDKPEYAVFFHTVLTQFPTLIPESCVFFPVLYTYNCLNNSQSRPIVMTDYCIKGSGTIYPEIASLCRDWAIKLKNHQNSTQYAFKEDLNVFTEHFAVLLPPEKASSSTLSGIRQRIFHTQPSIASSSSRSNSSQLPAIRISNNSPRVTQRKSLLNSLPDPTSAAKL